MNQVNKVNTVKNSSSKRKDPFNTRRNQPISRKGLPVVDVVNHNNQSTKIVIDSDDEYQTAVHPKESDNGEII